MGSSPARCTNLNYMSASEAISTLVFGPFIVIFALLLLINVAKEMFGGDEDD